MSEEYTLDQLRKMNQLDGSKKLIFVEQHKKVLQQQDKVWNIKHNELLDSTNKIANDNLNLLTKVEMCIVKPYEGSLQSKNQCCVELHRKMTDNLREWFDKLKKNTLCAKGDSK